MARHIVNVPESSSRRKFTAGQFLAEFAEVSGGRPRYLDLPHPVRVAWVNSTEESVAEVCLSAASIFAVFQRVHVAQGAIYRLSWRGCRIGPAGLFALNTAIRSTAIRKGGINIVRHWLETRKGAMTPLGCDLSGLFDYLEIRPIFRGKKAHIALSTSPTTILATP